MRKIINLIGQRFNRLTVIKYVGKNKSGNSLWLCKCDCGKETIVVGSNLKNGHIRSCGCLAIEKTIQRNKANAGLNKNCWTREEDRILKQFYLNKGVKYCSQKINRTTGSIASRAYEIGLHSNITTGDKLKRRIIRKISLNKVLSLCKVHGETIHYYRNNKIDYCLKCHGSRKYPLTEEQRKDRNKKMREYRKNPIINLSSKLRTLIGNALREISRDNNRKTKGCFRNLDFTPRDLYNYLENTRELQNNKCPHCHTSYDKCEMNIEHAIPLSTAKTEQQVIDLFCLQNLNLMCKSCNSSKQDTNYNDWIESKNLNI